MNHAIGIHIKPSFPASSHTAPYPHLESISSMFPGQPVEAISKFLYVRHPNTPGAGSMEVLTGDSVDVGKPIPRYRKICPDVHFRGNVRSESTSIKGLKKFKMLLDERIKGNWRGCMMDLSAEEIALALSETTERWILREQVFKEGKEF
jgi:hypothetical protein